MQGLWAVTAAVSSACSALLSKVQTELAPRTCAGWRSQVTNLASEPGAEVTGLGPSLAQALKICIAASPGSSGVHQPEHLDEGLLVPPQWHAVQGLRPLSCRCLHDTCPALALQLVVVRVKLTGCKWAVFSVIYCHVITHPRTQCHKASV